MGARSGGGGGSSAGYTVRYMNYKTGRYKDIVTKAKSFGGATKAAKRIEKISKGNMKWVAISANDRKNTNFMNKTK